MARIEYADPEDLPPEKRELLDTLSDDESGSDEHSLEGGTLNVYRTMGRNVDLLEAFRDYGSTVWQESGLTDHQREFAILATGYYAETSYEWQQHVRVALDAGMTPEQIAAISAEELDRLEPEHAAIVEYVEAFVEGSVDDGTHERLAEHYDEERILGIGMLAGCYLGLARVLQALDVDLEAPFVGWELEDL
ncbi:carboxymuconolactone decarboxylase family protein [Natronobacterium texcoconense]|uniref:Alkylhydroperoxidase family enzyme, contains CxxC motif n=1 Tax=Natronobacterium texcoconense TaxID=1095778 RepID=A0A1H0YXB7_NATTX|nr:carboxymuconolactone decarboxylase family protein [Natronobacterium texcoconense]SDQ19758.1 Alkylhydroperoxidase family enzyme, contains CxxC motif [Natronobacterium texcoconense]